MLSVTLPFDLELPARHLDASRRNVEVFTSQLLCPLGRPPLEPLKLRLDQLQRLLIASQPKFTVANLDDGGDARHQTGALGGVDELAEGADVQDLVAFGRIDRLLLHEIDPLSLDRCLQSIERQRLHRGVVHAGAKMQLSIHDRRRLRLDEGIARSSNDEVEGSRIETMVGLHHLHVQGGSQDGQLLVCGSGLHERFDEVAGKKIHAIHGGGPERTTIRRIGDPAAGWKCPGALWSRLLLAQGNESSMLSCSPCARVGLAWEALFIQARGASKGIRAAGASRAEPS